MLSARKPHRSVAGRMLPLSVFLVIVPSSWGLSTMLGNASPAHRERAEPAILAPPTVTGSVMFPMQNQATISMTVAKDDVAYYKPSFYYAESADKYFEVLNPLAADCKSGATAQPFAFNALSVSKTYLMILGRFKAASNADCSAAVAEKDWTWYEIWDVKDQSDPVRLVSFRHKTN